MTIGIIRTLLRDVQPTELGIVDYHDHLFQATPLLPGDDLDDERKSDAEAQELVSAGVNCLVEATPYGLGRNPSAAARISRDRQLHVVHATGVHREAHYKQRPDVTAMSSDELRRIFRAELCDGFTGDVEPAGPDGESPMRAGLVKLGVSYWSLTSFERRALDAVGAASVETGAPVMVHLEYATAAHEVLTMLEELGCPPSRVALAHVDRNPDPGLHLELAARGAFLGYDGCARARNWPDNVLIECLAQVVADGGGGHVLLGGDVARSSRYVAYGGMPGLAYTYRRFLPRVRLAIGDDATAQLTRSNPARWLTWAGPIAESGEER